MTRPAENGPRPQPEARDPEPQSGLGTVGTRATRAAALVLAALVALAVYAPLLAGDRPLLVRARLPGLIEHHLKNLSRAFPYDLRHGAAEVEAQVERTLVELQALVDARSASRLAAFRREWEHLGAAADARERRLALLAAVTDELENAVPRRRTLFPALASLGTVESLLAAVFPALLLLLWCLRRSVIRLRRALLVVAAGLALVLALAIWRPPTAAGLDSPRAVAAVRAADRDATLIMPPIPFGPERAETAERLQPPLTRSRSGGTHWLGTDDLGRDLAALLVWGARTSLLVGAASVALLLLIGVIVGAAAGYFRGGVDLVISRLIEVFQAFPSLILILAAVAFLKNGLLVVILVIGCTRWTTAARLVRGEFLRLGRAEFVVAARALGFSAPRIILRHILPSALGPVLVHAVFAVAAAVLVESSLAFLGLGDPHSVSWGQAIDRGRHFMSAWWITVFPGIILFLTLISLRVFGEGLRSDAGARGAS